MEKGTWIEWIVRAAGGTSVEYAKIGFGGPADVLTSPYSSRVLV